MYHSGLIYSLRLGLFVLACGIGGTLFGQNVPINRGNNPGQMPELESREQSEETELDTFPVFFFYQDNPNLEIPFQDTLLNNNFQQLDITRRRDLDYAHLGIIGSAHQPIVFEPSFRRGFDIGFHQYDLYFTRALDMQYYRVERPFTNLSYAQGGEQADILFEGQFSRNFSDGINLSLDYRRISFIGDQLQYLQQKTRNTSLAFGLWYHDSSDRYDGFLTYATNSVQRQENGGIETDTLPDADFDSPSAFPTFLQAAESRQAHDEISYTHYFKFGGKIDTLLGRRRRSFTISHQFLYANSIYKFSDAFPSVDTSYFRSYPNYLTDERGVRLFMEHRQIENSFRLSTFRLDKEENLQARNQRDLLEVGLTHSYNRIDEEARDTVIQNLFLTGKLRFNPNERLRIVTYGHFGLLDNVGDYRLEGELLLNFKKLGQLKVEASNQLSSPTYVQHRFFVTQRKIWDNDFERTLQTSITGTYSLPNIRFEVTGAYHLLNNYIYYDTLALPTQTGTPVSILQLIAKQNFKVWSFHLDNLVAFQQSSEDFIRLPEIFGKHSLYYEGMWFRVLFVRVGFDLRYNTSYFSNYYQPLAGQFILQDDQEVQFYPAIDGFFSMKVAKFRAFFKWENFNRLWDAETLFYQTAFYPNQTSNFRLGIKWQFTN